MPGQKKKTGLGRALIRSRFQAAGRAAHVNPDGSIRHTTELNDSTGSWVNMQSVTQETDLEAFLNTAQLAGTEFTAERLNVTVVSSQDSTASNPFLLTPDREAEELEKHRQHRDRLTVPRRPHWTTSTTGEELQAAERESFLDWRRNLVFLEEQHGLILTPYERNIEVWRQLWRVIERSDLIVQIVDARNPMFFRSADLETYVVQVSPSKKNMLLINKADLLTKAQRQAWSDYFEREGVRHIFFSATLAKERMEAEMERERQSVEAAAVDAEYNALADQGFGKRRDPVVENDENIAAGENEEEQWEDDNNDDHEHGDDGDGYSQDGDVSDANETVESDSDARRLGESDRTRILDAHELVELFQNECPRPNNTTVANGEHGGDARPAAKTTIGFVGYPNVGKSSTLNALVGAKRVAVGATPGKTKHFQTIHLSDTMVLCDCPGLVFPSFATTKAEMVCCGVLPIDQLREHTGPTGLVCQRIPKAYLEALYGISIKTRGSDGDLIDRQPTAEEFLSSYAIARGYVKSSQGNPDESRAARYILKDYVYGKLLYVHPPPDTDITGTEFNRQIYQSERLLRKQIKKLNLSDLKTKADLALVETPLSRQQRQLQQPTSANSAADARAIDATFFSRNVVSSRGAHGVSGWAGRATVPGAGRATATATTTSTDANDNSQPQPVLPPKKSHKKGARQKNRTYWTKQDD